MKKNAFGLMDEEFWTNPWKNLRELSWERVEKEITGIVIAAPSKVDLNKHDSLPLLVFISGSNEELAKNNFNKHAVIVVEDMKTGKKEKYSYHSHHDAPMSEKPERPSPGFSGIEYNIDLFEQGMLKQPGKYKISIQAGTMKSNVVEGVIEG